MWERPNPHHPEAHAIAKLHEAFVATLVNAWSVEE
jgi:hypothetical protein